MIKYKNILLPSLLAVLVSSAYAADKYVADEYEIETSHNDVLFIINGEEFDAQGYCFNMEEGDRVIFLEGNPFGTCVLAKILNLRTKDVCVAWCE